MIAAGIAAAVYFGAGELVRRRHARCVAAAESWKARHRKAINVSRDQMIANAGGEEAFQRILQTIKASVWPSVESPLAAAKIGQPAGDYYVRGGIKVSDIVETYGLDRYHYLAAALEYVLRAGHKTSSPVDDLAKAAWHVQHHLRGGTMAHLSPAPPVEVHADQVWKIAQAWSLPDRRRLALSSLLLASVATDPQRHLVHCNIALAAIRDELRRLGWEWRPDLAPKAKEVADA